jgi:hypothetical protein
MKASLVLLFVLTPTLVTAQRPTVLTQRNCENCTIRLIPLVTLPGIDSLGGVTNTAFLAKDSRGRYYHTNWHTSSVIQVFDSAGRPFTTIGKKGSGPGEFLSASYIAHGVGDTLHVFDQTTRRYTVLSPDYEVVRTTDIGAAVVAAAELKPGKLILSTHIRSREGFGHPLRFWTQQGLQPGFGGADALKNGPVPDSRSLFRSIAVSADGSFWTARRNEYMLEQWSADGKLLRQLVRQIDWFEPYLIDDSFTGGPPRPFVVGINEDRSGRLWVLIAVANPNWQRAMGRGPTINGTQSTRVVSPDPSAVRWTRIEVIDPRQTQVMTSSLFRQAFDGFSTGGSIFGVVVNNDDIPIMRVWRLDSTN